MVVRAWGFTVGTNRWADNSNGVVGARMHIKFVLAAGVAISAAIAVCAPAAADTAPASPTTHSR
jgi:hypothetical protein